MIAASVAVITLIVWALTRSFSAPVTSSIPVETAPTAGLAPPAATRLSGEPVQSPEEASVVRISPQDLRQKTLRGEVTVIDVRSAADFQLAHLPGSLHVPLANVEAQIAYLPKGKPIVAYCT
jgi:Rhodanese-like domain